jgi:hypothetical protein
MVVSRHVTETEHGVAEASILSELAGSNQGAPRKRQGSETYPGVAAARHKLPRVAPASTRFKKETLVHRCTRAIAESIQNTANPPLPWLPSSPP